MPSNKITISFSKEDQMFVAQRENGLSALGHSESLALGELLFAEREGIDRFADGVRGRISRPEELIRELEEFFGLNDYA